MPDYRARLDRIEAAIAPELGRMHSVWCAKGQTEEQAIAEYAEQNGGTIDDDADVVIIVRWLCAEDSSAAASLIYG